METTPGADFAELFAAGARKAEHGQTGPPKRFDAAAAKAALTDAARQLGTCRERGGPRGKVTVVVTFEASGKVESASVSEPPFAGTSTGTCVANVSASRLALKTERVTRITGENGYVKIDYATKNGTVIRRRANEMQMREIREQLRRGLDLTSLKWQELVNVEPLVIDDAEPIVMEIRAFLDAVTSGTRPPIDADAGFAAVRTAERIVKAIKDGM